MRRLSMSFFEIIIAIGQRISYCFLLLVYIFQTFIAIGHHFSRDELDDSGLLNVTASNNEPEVLQPVNVNTSRKPTPKKDGVFKVPLPVENRPASRASSR